MASPQPFRRNGQQQSLPPANTLKNLKSNLKKLGLGEQSAALASNISAIDAFIETNLDNSQENEQTMRIQASRAALAEALDTLDILKVGLYDRMVYAILDFFGMFFSYFREKAQDWLIQRTVDERQAFFSALFNLSSNLQSSDAIQAIGQIRSAIDQSHLPQEEKDRYLDELTHCRAAVVTPIENLGAKAEQAQPNENSPAH